MLTYKIIQYSHLQLKCAHISDTYSTAGVNGRDMAFIAPK